MANREGEDIAAVINESLKPLVEKVDGISARLDGVEKSVADLQATREQSLNLVKGIDEEIKKVQRSSDANAALLARKYESDASRGNDVPTPKRGETAEQFVDRVVRGNNNSDKRGLSWVRNLRARAAVYAERGQIGTHEDVLRKLESWGPNDEALKIAHQARKDGQPFYQRNLATTFSQADGGAFVPPGPTRSFTEFAFATLPFVELGAHVESVKVGSNVHIPYVDDTIGGGFRAEGEVATEGSVKTGMLQVSPRPYSIWAAFTNEWLKAAEASTDVMFRDLLASQLNYVVTKKLLSGVGAADDVHGMEYWLGVANPANGGVARRRNRTPGLSASVVQKEIDTLELDILNLPKISGSEFGFIMTKRVARGLMRLERNGNYVFRDEMRAGTLNGGRFVGVSDHLTKGLLAGNLAGDGGGSGTLNKSIIYCADFSTMMIAMSEDEEVVLPYGTFMKNGVVRSGLMENKTVVVMHGAVEMALLQRGAEAYALDSVDWQDI